MVRTIDLNNSWTAHEWKTWMLFWVPLLSPIYQKHHPDISELLTNLTLGIILLLGNEITEDTIVRASQLLQSVCENMETCFGIQYCTLNVHILSHLGNTVRNWGPLW